MLQAWDNNRAKLDHIPMSSLTLNHKVCCQTELALRAMWKLSVGSRVKSNDGNIISTAHEFAVLTRLAIDVRLEDFHHVLFGVAYLAGRAVTVGGDIQGLVMAMQELDDVRWGRCIDNGRGDELVHSLVVRGIRGVVNKSSTADVDCA